MSEIRKVIGVDVRILYIISLVIIAIPYVRPLGLPVLMDDRIQELYDILDNLPDGTVILYNQDSSPAEFGDARPVATAVLRKILRKNVKLIIVHLKDGSVSGTTPLLLEYTKDLLAEEEYGVDYALFGFVPGLETAVASLAANIPDTLVSDMYGTPVEDLPIMEGLETGADIDYLLVGTVADISGYYMRQWSSLHGTPLIAIGDTSDVLTFIPFYETGQYFSCAGGSVEGAMLEILMNEPSFGATQSDIMSMGNIYLVSLIIFANIIYFYNIYIKKVGARVKREVY